MADKIKKVSINAFEEAVNSQYEATQSFEWNGITIVVKRNLTLREMMSFVDSVVKNCFKEEDGTFIPEIKDFATRSCIYEYYTNITLPANIEKRYDLLYHQMLLDEIMPRIDSLQFNALIRAIEDKVAHLAQANIEAVTKQMNELYASVDGLQGQLESVFSGISGEDIQNFMAAFGNGEINEEKIAKAVMSVQKESNKK